MIADELYTALSGLAGGRVYPRLAPQAAAAPYIVYWHVAIGQDAAYPIGVGYNRYRIQVEAYAASYAAIVTLRGQIHAAVQAMPELIETGIDFESEFDPDTGHFGWVFDFTFRQRQA
jgi:hypothetical protein